MDLCIVLLHSVIMPNIKITKTNIWQASLPEMRFVNPIELFIKDFMVKDIRSIICGRDT